MTGIPTIDLFSGVGGLSLGAVHAGADVRALVDIDPIASATARANYHHAGARVIEADVSQITGQELRELAGVDVRDPLLLVGGPPCQPFSKAAYWVDDGDDARYRRARTLGAWAPRPGRYVARPDARRALVREFFRLVLESRADAFLMENVPSILHPRNRDEMVSLIDEIKRERYFVTVIRANAADYGVPQQRHRVFFLGSRALEPIAPSATHSLTDPGKPWVVSAGAAISRFAGDAFFEEGETVEGRWAAHLRDVPPGWNYKFHTAWAGHPAPTFIAEARFWNFLLKLHPDRTSWTIAASPGPWTGPFHWENRRLRTVEMAAIQGFPADYQFLGTRRDRVRQIGNAVPPPLAEPMVRALLDTLDNVRRAAA